LFVDPPLAEPLSLGGWSFSTAQTTFISYRCMV
jgi:hypothetical protein